MLNQLHNQVLEFVENYRKKNPAFTYTLRKINNKDRLSKGMWFLGREDYASVGLINRSGGLNKTQSFFMNFKPVGNDFKCNVFLITAGEKDSRVVEFYKKILNHISGFKALNNGKYKLALAKTNGFEEATRFLDQYLMKIYTWLQESELDDLRYNQSDFSESLARINSIIQNEENTPNYWIFQGNPKVFDFEGAIKSGLLSSWTVTAHRDKIRTGDKVILWITGPKAGCYALAEVTSLPFQRAESADDQYYKTESKSDWQVSIKFIHDLHESPILLNTIKADARLKHLKVGNQGTNFSATKEEFEILRSYSASEKRESARYWVYAPGAGADRWDDFYKLGVIGLGWEELGDLSHYPSKRDIEIKLQELEKVTTSKRNDATACYEFRNVMKPGDIILVKKGRSELLGYGVVDSDYYFDSMDANLSHRRKMLWKKKGSWTIPYDLPLKTLTDITQYDGDPPHNKYYEQLLGEMGSDISDVETSQAFNKNLNASLNTILYGPPGTGKTYRSVKKAAEIISQQSISNFKSALEIFNKSLHDQIEFITFHQNYSYEDFIQGLRPDIENNQSLTFERKDGIFKIIADRALKNLRESETLVSSKRNFEDVFAEFIRPLEEGEVQELEVKMKKVSFYITDIGTKSIDFRKASGGTAHSLSINTLQKMYDAESVLYLQGLSVYYTPLIDRLLQLGKNNPRTKVERKNYVLIIDEINRANISRVFGELITLIEPDKRSHGAIPLEVKLPSGEPFIVPSNLYIIGTMNTADKSIALLDIALRRRFEFEAMFPQYEIEGGEIYDIDLLQKLNQEIINNKGHDFQIGHAYFMGDNKNLLQRMNNKVIPLLLEYYMNDKQEVTNLLQRAGLEVDKGCWPIKITGRRG